MIVQVEWPGGMAWQLRSCSRSLKASFSNDRFLNWDYDRFGEADSVSKELQAGISDLIYNSVGGPQLRTCN